MGWKFVVVLFGVLSLLNPLSVARGAADAPAVTVTLNEKSLPSSPGYHLIHATALVGTRKITLTTGIFLPRAYFQSKDPLPIVMTLHNRGSSGYGGGGLTFEGLGMLVAQDNPDSRGTGEKPKNPINLRTDAQFICLVPQCPGVYHGWEVPPMGKILGELITQVAKAYHADEDRVYLTGFSYGASSTWRVAMQIPDRFAAIAPLDGRATPDPIHDMEKLKDVGIYEVVGAVDEQFIPEAERMRDALIAVKHRRFVYRVVPDGNHWGYASVYDDPNFWNWLLAQSRHGSATTRPTTQPVTENAPSTTQPATTQPATVLCQYYRDIPGVRIKALTDDPAFPKFPNEQVLLTQMEIPPNQEPGYGSTLRGLLHAPATGDYTFYIAADNQGELWLSTDDSAEHIVQIANVPDWSLPRNWTQSAQQQSKPVQLIAGKSYYIEARHKSGAGDNHLAIAWKLPDGTMEGPIPGSRLSALPPADVPAPKIVGEPKELPNKPGAYRISVDVEYLAHKLTIPVLLIIPQIDAAPGKRPALVFYADTDREADAQGYRMQGPARELTENVALAAWSPLYVIAPQCPAGQSWDILAVQYCTTAVVDHLLKSLSTDNERVYLTGSGTGATALWRIAPLLSARCAVIAPISTREVKNPQLAAALDGADVHIITGVLDGMATDCANRMKDALASIHPAPDVVYEMKMGSDVAATYYARQEFYQSLLAWRRPAGQAAVR